MKVNRISLFLMAGLLISLANSAKGASDYCAFEVKVTDPSGAPLAGIPVAMIQQDDKEFGREVRTDHDGRARLCDAPKSRSASSSGLTYAEPSRSKQFVLPGPRPSAYL